MPIPTRGHGVPSCSAAVGVRLLRVLDSADRILAITDQCDAWAW
jgi:hypothetical protein